MNDEAQRVATLTTAEKEALRAYLLSSDVKGVARQIGRSPHTADQRLRRSRAKLGVHRSLDAALMLARVENDQTYGSAVYTDPVSEISEEDMLEPETADDGSPTPLPAAFPTPDRPWNMLPVPRRLLWILAGLVAVMVCVVLMADLMETATRIAQLNQ